MLTFNLKNGKTILPLQQNIIKHTDTGNFWDMQSSIVSCIWNGSWSNMGITEQDPIVYEFSNGAKLIFELLSNKNVRYHFENSDGVLVGINDFIYFGTEPIMALFVTQCKTGSKYDSGDGWTLGVWNVIQLGSNRIVPPVSTPSSNNPTLININQTFILPNSSYPEGSQLSTVWYKPGVSFESGAQNQLSYFNLIYGSAEQPDPYERAGTTEKRGGTGNLDDTSDPIDFPSLPSLNALNTGFVSLYAPTVSQVANLVNYMWSSDFVDSLVKMFTSPIESIIQFGMLPVSIPSAIDSDVHLCNKSTGVSMNKAINQFIEIDCGSIDVDEYWGSYLDYAPYTKIAIYCPFSDIHELECDDVMGQTLQLKYHIDILSGSFVAFLKCGDSVKYTWGGNMLVQLPITQSNWGQTYSAIAQFGASAVGTVATGGISALASASTLSSASNVMNSKPTVSRSGGIGGASAYMSVKTPYLIIKRPKQALAQNYSTYRGYPSNIEVSLADVSGYTEIESIHLDNIPCTQEEKNEIENLLNKGVIF